MNAKFALLSLLLLGFSKGVHAGDLDWLVGCWETPDQSAKEVWVKEQNGDLIGFNVVLDGGKVVFYEVLRISTTNGGFATYTAHPIGQPAASFTTKAITSTEVTFSNPSHDYPQEISYKRDDLELIATISALNGANSRSFNKSVCE